MASSEGGLVLFAYDGSDLAGYAIEHAAGQLSADRDALVVCVWQPADVGFEPATPTHFDADQADAVRRAAEATAAKGAEIAQRVGFRAESMAVEAAPTWKGIVEAAGDRGATLIVIGTHHRGGIVGHLLGSVASAVVAHSPSSVLIVHARD
jgi:nucleotide-binding universal stress UspA family protein